ncbi:MAG: DUF5335 family protein [Pyrinomonadaceae bacterium]
MSGFIERDQWKTFLDEFSKRNQLRATRLEIIGEVGAQEEEVYLPLVGISFEDKGSAAGSVEIILGGETAKEERHLDHLVPNVQRIAPLLGTTSLEEGLGIENDEGTKVLVRFKALPEIEEVSSDEREQAATSGS